MTIKLNEFDRKLLANIKPSDKWNKLKPIYSIYIIVKQLKIGNNKIGSKCAKHLQKLSKKDTITLNEIKEGCKDLIPKKHKHGLAKSKDKAPIEKTHKINNTEKPSNQKIKHTSHKQPENPTDKLVNLLLIQQQQLQKQTIQRQVDLVDKKLIERNDFPKGEAGDILGQKYAGAPRVYKDVLRDWGNGTGITGLSEGEAQLFRHYEDEQAVRDQTRGYDFSSVSLPLSLTDSEKIRFNSYKSKIDEAREARERTQRWIKQEQDLSGFSITNDIAPSIIERQKQIFQKQENNPAFTDITKKLQNRESQEEKNKLIQEMIQIGKINRQQRQQELKPPSDSREWLKKQFPKILTKIHLKKQQLKADLKPRGDRVNELLKMSGGDRDFYENIKSAGQEFRQRQQREQRQQDAEEPQMEEQYSTNEGEVPVDEPAPRFKY